MAGYGGQAMNGAERGNSKLRIGSSTQNPWTIRAGFRNLQQRNRRAQPWRRLSLNHLAFRDKWLLNCLGFLPCAAGRRLRSVHRTRFSLACKFPRSARKSGHCARSAVRNNWAVIELYIENHDMAGSLTTRKKASNGSFWSEKEIDVLVENWKQGMRMAEIAALLGRSKKSVVVKASRLGLTRRSYLNENHIERAKRNGKTRSCLLCQARFYSEGPGNRVCAKCKQGEYWETGGDSFCSAR